MIKLTPSYIAGFFDGEGSICLMNSSHNTFELLVCIGQNDPEILEALKAKFGGTVHYWRCKRFRRIYPRWTVRAKLAENFLRWMAPYIQLKSRELKLALLQRSLVSRNYGAQTGKGGGNKMPNKIRQKMRAVRKKLQKLNRGGYIPLRGPK